MQQIKNLLKRIFANPIVEVFLRLKIQPNLITVISLFFALVAFFFYKNGNFVIGAVFLFLCGIFDTFDGEVARRTGRVTKLGGFLDSTIDRINEFLIYLGLFFYYYQKANYVLVWILFVIFGSMMVSYTRARGEGLGISPQVGIFERFTRILLLIIGSFLGPDKMVYILFILAIGTFLTTIQRIIFVHSESKS